MAAFVVRNLSEEVHRALKARAKKNGVSAEAEARSILEHAVLPKERVRFGSALYAMSRSFGGVDLNVKRDKSPTEPANFE